jgi:SAM-dependent methyltransferase
VSDAPPRTLSDLDPTGRFSTRAADYAKYRPTYPAATLDAILSGLRPPATLLAADMGAGTGISARALAERGVHVLAIEPNRAMRDEAEPHPRVSFIDATAERTGLPPGSIDLVLCAQSFHWFESGPALAEFKRILVPGGRVALVWNGRNRGDPVADEYDRLVREAATIPPSHLRQPAVGAALLAAGLSNVREVSAVGGQSLDLAGVIGRARSASYVPASGPAWERLEAGLRALHAARADASGRVFVAQSARAWLAETRGPDA